MGVLSTTTATPAQQAAAQILQMAANQFRQLAQSGNMGYRLVWNNPRATPRDVIAALGTNAQAIFALQSLLMTTVASAAQLGGTAAPPIPSVPAGYTVTFNSDGSAKVVQTGSSSSSSPGIH